MTTTDVDPGLHGNLLLGARSAAGQAGGSRASAGADGQPLLAHGVLAAQAEEARALPTEAVGWLRVDDVAGSI